MFRRHHAAALQTARESFVGDSSRTAHDAAYCSTGAWRSVWTKTPTRPVARSWRRIFAAAWAANVATASRSAHGVVRHRAEGARAADVLLVGDLGFELNARLAAEFVHDPLPHHAQVMADPVGVCVPQLQGRLHPDLCQPPDVPRRHAPQVQQADRPHGRRRVALVPDHMDAGRALAPLGQVVRQLRERLGRADPHAHRQPGPLQHPRRSISPTSRQGRVSFHHKKLSSIE